jgi:hypothetical protein
MSVIKKTISINKNIAKEVSAINSNFSAIVEEALVEYIHHYYVQKASNSFGKWKERESDSANLVSNLRNKDDREFVICNDIKNKKIVK